MFKYHSDMGHCFLIRSSGLKIVYIFFYFESFLYLGKMDLVLGKKVGYFQLGMGSKFGP